MRKILLLLLLLTSPILIYSQHGVDFFPVNNHVAMFSGDIYYVSTGGNDSYSGKNPDAALLTIGAAIGKLSAGDAINVMAGTYTETGLDLNVNSCELWFEIGAVIDPASGTALTISGHYCRVTCAGGALKITPATDQTGVLVSGNFCYLNEIRVSCFNTDEATSADVGFDITGDGCDLRKCRVASPDVVAFKIQGDKVKLEDCCTGGGANGTVFSSIGFWMTNSCDKFRLKNCGSQGHGTAGYQIDAGCTNGVAEECYSGGGDGKWIDADNDCVWSSFSYDDEIFKEIEFTDATQAFDLFTVTGIIEIEFLHAHVEEATNGELGNCKFRVYGTDGTTDTDLTTATDCENLPIGSLIAKIAAAGEALDVSSSATPFVVENTNFRDPRVKSFVGADNTGTTTIQFYSNDSVGDKDGVIHFHCKWRPVSDNGWLSAL